MACSLGRFLLWLVVSEDFSYGLQSQKISPMACSLRRFLLWLTVTKAFLSLQKIKRQMAGSASVHGHCLLRGTVCNVFPTSGSPRPIFVMAICCDTWPCLQQPPSDRCTETATTLFSFADWWQGSNVAQSGLLNLHHQALVFKHDVFLFPALQMWTLAANLVHCKVELLLATQLRLLAISTWSLLDFVCFI